MKTPLLFALCSLACLAFAEAGSHRVSRASVPRTPLFPFVSSSSQKLGYMDAAGKVVIEARFDLSCDSLRATNCLVDSLAETTFSEGLAKVRVGKRYGYINEEGAIRIAAQYEEAGPFSCGVALAKQKDKFGYIDINGHTVIEPTFDEAGNFAEGLARVRIDYKYGFIDRTGRVVIAPQWREAGPFSDGLALVQVDFKYGFIDRFGFPAIAPTYDMAGPFAEGLAAVRVKDKVGYITTRGAFAISPRYTDAEEFSEGAALVTDDHKTYRYIDHNGATLLTVTEGRPYHFRNGLALVDLGSQMVLNKSLGLGDRGRDRCREFFREQHRLQIGYIDKSGKFVYSGTALVEHACLPQAGSSSTEFYNEVPPVTITITSDPSPTAIYLISKFDWQHHQADIVRKILAHQFSTPLTGSTPYQGQRVAANVYQLVLEYQGLWCSREHDFEPEGTTNTVPLKLVANDPLCH